MHTQDAPAPVTQHDLIQALESDHHLAEKLAALVDGGHDLDREAVEAAIELVVRGKEQVSRAKGQLNAFRARVKGVESEAERRLAFVTSVIGLEALTRYVLSNANKGKQTLLTPRGTIAVRRAPGGPTKEDEDKIRDYCLMNGLTEFLEPQPDKVLWAPLKKHLEETGEDVPGVSFKEPTTTLSFDGKEG